MGRHKQYSSSADRQKAYRERMSVTKSVSVTKSSESCVTKSPEPEPVVTLEPGEAAQCWWAIGNVANCFRSKWDAETLETLDGMLAGVAGNNPHAQGRCGYGPRLPLLVISLIGTWIAIECTFSRLVAFTPGALLSPAALP